MIGESTQRNLAGTTAIVTGASRGLGRAYTRVLAAAGATVVCVARTRPDLEKTVDEVINAGGAALVCVADVSSADGVREVMARTERAYGVPDRVQVGRSPDYPRKAPRCRNRHRE